MMQNNIEPVIDVTNKPRLSRRNPPAGVGIVHIGPGAFFRSFIATYTDATMKESGAHWGITAVSLQSSHARDQLMPQQGSFTAINQTPQGSEFNIIESIVEVLVAPDNPQAVIDRLCEPNVHIVTLTVTEKGYCHLPASGQLNIDHPDIQHDLSNSDSPKSVLGFLVEALAQRQSNGVQPFSVVSCDNLPSNGELVRRVVLEFAALRDKALAQWIETEVSFPSTMVDRITPATTEQDIETLANVEGYYDPACVLHEPFSQWVIEDNFNAPRPQWEKAGAQLVSSVDAHELMKLRCLNGTHSTLAYLGYLAGHRTISETVADEVFSSLCQHLWQHEILPTLEQPEGEDLSAYCDSLLERYRNPAIQHRNWQIAMDGSQKLPQRLLGTVRDNLAEGKLPNGLCLVIAAWMRYVEGVDEDGDAIDVRDPLASQLRELINNANGSDDKVDALLGIVDIFPTDLAAHAEFRNGLVEAFEKLTTLGARHCISELLTSN